VCSISFQRLGLHVQVQALDRNESYQRGEQVDPGLRQALPIIVFLMDGRIPIAMLPLEGEAARPATFSRAPIPRGGL
jgi:hypothetical protein